jgi:hypothetical protein
VRLSQARPDRAWGSTRTRNRFTVGLPLLVQLSPRITSVKLQLQAGLPCDWNMGRIEFLFTIAHFSG